MSILVSLGKEYPKLATVSIGSGIGQSLMLEQDYKTSNLTYDMSVGVLWGKLANEIISLNQLTRGEKRFFRLKSEGANYFFGSGVASALSETIDSMDKVLIPNVNWRKKLWVNDD